MVTDLFTIFLTGLAVGGLTCLVVQGGLLASVITARTMEDKVQRAWYEAFWPTLAFLGGKIFIHSLLGFILGAFGSAFTLSSGSRAFVQFLAGAYMLAIAMDLLKVHPIFKYALIQPPRFLRKLIRNQSKSEKFFAPALLGIMTVFIPCGTTIAMETYAIASGNAVWGFLIMASFTLGTVPLFLGLGYATSEFGNAFRDKFFKLAAILLIYLGLSTINAGLVLSGSQFTFENIIENVLIKEFRENLDVTKASEEGGEQIVRINATPRGYSPNFVRVKAGVPVKLRIHTESNFSCSTIFTIPSLGIEEVLPFTGDEEITFTPESPGKITFSCSMGMYKGVIEVL